MKRSFIALCVVMIAGPVSGKTLYQAMSPAEARYTSCLAVLALAMKGTGPWRVAGPLAKLKCEAEKKAVVEENGMYFELEQMVESSFNR